jgi:ABC-2 type transport system permease protein
MPVSENWWCKVGEIANLGSDLRIAWRIAALRLRGQMAYRTSFLMQIFGNFIINFVEVIVLWALFQRFESMGGWNLREVVFLHGLAMTMFTIGDTVSNGLQSVPDLNREGTFDRLMLRPMSTYVQALVNEVSLRHLGHMFQGVLLLGIGIGSGDIDWTLPKAIYLLVVLLSGGALFASIFTIEAIISFWTVNSIEAVNALTYGGSDLGQYPLHIFQRGMRLLFLWVVPIGFLTYYPALYFLDKPDPLGLPEAVQYIAPIPAIVFCVVIGRAWSFAVRHYRSTGS